METLLILLGLYLVVALFAFPLWAIVRIRTLTRDQQLQAYETSQLKAELAQLQASPPRAAAPAASAVSAPPAPAPAAAPIAASPAPLPLEATPAPVLESAPAEAFVAPVPEAVPAEEPPPLPPPLPPAPPAYVPPPPAAPQPGWLESINWEQFMGAKLFAWLGGLALFLGVAFFVKYSFDHGWVPPELRVAMGFVFSLGLIIGGLRINRDRFGITAQTLIATGVVSLYAVTFACRSVYHFEFFGTIPTFLLMVLITATAFLLAVRLSAQVVAVLGMLGGFLTPVLLSTGVDNPGGLFGYLALLNVGLIAVALRTGWNYLVPLGAGGTALMMAGWADKFFTAEKGPVAMVVALGFSALFLIAAEIAARRDARPGCYRWTAVAMPLVGFAFAFYFLDYSALAARAPLYFGFVLLLDAALLRLAWRDEALPRLPLGAGILVFLLLAVWTAGHLTDALLPSALAAYLLFAAMHTAFPLVLERVRPSGSPSGWSQLFPPMALLLIMLPLGRLDNVPFLIWPAILLADLLAIALAVASASLAAVAAVLVLTLVATGVCIFRVPAHLALEPSLLLALGGFAVFFFVASLWVVRRLGDRLPAVPDRLGRVFGDARTQLPAFSALLPFLLLVMVCLRLDVPDPSMVFGLGLLLVVLVLGLVRLLAIEWLPLCALLGITAVEYTWHGHNADFTHITTPLLWYLGFAAVFAIYPFVFRRRFENSTGPWAVAALGGILPFPLVYRLVLMGEPNGAMGLLPAAFSIPPLLSLALVLRFIPAAEPKRLNQLAWFGGAGLFFITLIFPIQFDRQWLTVAWALEGAALLWLFHRVPHGGLRLVGTALLLTAFTRLAGNSAVLSYHVRGETPILNWYLYAYGLAIAALFAGARLLAPPRERVLGVTMPPLLNTLGVILAFLLLNIEIADYFTSPGAATLTFRFSGYFGRDMTYTIAWALFALGLLVAGIWRQTKAARYAAIALLCVVLAKLFLHDLARLEALYRIGALFGVAVIAIVASFAYQRFLPSNEKTPPPAS